jgi:Tfp pilus assembly protein PilX
MDHMTLNRRTKKRQNGVVLLIAMIFLLLLAIIAGTVTQTSILEFFMAGNAQFREEAFQEAQAVVTEISSDINNFPVAGGIGYTACKTGAGCDSNLIPLVGAVSTTADYRVVRRGPLILESLPFRQGESSGSSSPTFDAVIFEIQVAVDGSDSRLGSAEIVQGMAVRIASSGQ